MSTKKMFVTTYHSKVNTLLQLERNGSVHLGSVHSQAA